VNCLITHEKRMVRTKRLVQKFYSIRATRQAGMFPFPIPSELSLHAVPSPQHCGATRSKIPQRSRVSS
jgi:hypothetical protein